MIIGLLYRANSKRIHPAAPSWLLTQPDSPLTGADLGVARKIAGPASDDIHALRGTTRGHP